MSRHRRRNRYVYGGARTEPPAITPICPYCKKSSIASTGADLYPHRPDLAAKRFFRCIPCDARVGCHPGSWTPLGGLANAETRAARSRAHKLFDELWQGKMRRDGCSQYDARTAAYAWLAAEMGIELKDCHIGMMDAVECKTVIEICEEAKNGVRKRDEAKAGQSMAISSGDPQAGRPVGT